MCFKLSELVTGTYLVSNQYLSVCRAVSDRGFGIVNRMSKKSLTPPKTETIAVKTQHFPLTSLVPSAHYWSPSVIT